MKFAALTAFSLLTAGARAGDISFSGEIQPILSNKCDHCHGPDVSKRDAGLRLDTFEGTTAVIEESKTLEWLDAARYADSYGYLNPEPSTAMICRRPC